MLTILCSRLPPKKRYCMDKPSCDYVPNQPSRLSGVRLLTRRPFDYKGRNKLLFTVAEKTSPHTFDIQTTTSHLHQTPHSQLLPVHLRTLDTCCLLGEVSWGGMLESLSPLFRFQVRGHEENPRRHSVSQSLTVGLCGSR